MEISNKTSFITGQIVFVKLKGYPHWPAKITEICTNDKNCISKYKVIFFGDNNTADVRETDMYCYEQSKDLYGKPKIDNFKNKVFNKALKEAENAFSNTKCLNPDRNTTVDSNVLPLENQQLRDVLNKVQDLQEQEQNPDDLETSLTLAVEAGHALLLEKIN